MSSNLTWRPVPKPPKARDLGYSLKFAIALELWGHDGSLTSEWTEVGPAFIPFLRGIMAGNEEAGGEAQKLIDLIEKHGSVEIRLVN